MNTIQYSLIFWLITLNYPLIDGLNYLYLSSEYLLESIKPTDSTDFNLGFNLLFFITFNYDVLSSQLSNEIKAKMNCVITLFRLIISYSYDPCIYSIYFSFLGANEQLKITISVQLVCFIQFS